MSQDAAEHIGTNRQLFVDDYLIESMQGVNLKLHGATPAGNILTLDAPWEGSTCDYHTVFQDGEMYRMYYRGSSHEGYVVEALLEPGERVVPVHPETICYAESTDGIHWTKPELSLIEFDGSTRNNIVWLDERTETRDMVPFLDGNPQVRPEEQYKGIVWKGSEVFAVASPDAITWRFMRDEPILTERPFDTQNVPFWDPWREEYVIYTRGMIGTGSSFEGGYRWIRRATSSDFFNWSPLEPIDTGDSPHEHLYTNGTVPYPRAPGVYLSFPRRFHPDRVPLDDSKWPGTADAVFMSSRDGLHWDRRFMESIVRPGIGPRNWTSRNNLLSCGIVETGEAELSMYVLRHRDFPSVHIERVTFRKDGFVSANAGYDGGELTTKPLIFDGRELELNYSTSAVGSIRIELQDESGRPIEGWSLDDSAEIFGDHIERVARWEGGADLSAVAGQPVRLRFMLADADLYSFRFRA